MPNDATPAQATAARTISPTGGAQPPAKTTAQPSTAETQQTQATAEAAAELTLEQASALLGGSPDKAMSREIDPLADPADHDPLADPTESDPLAVGELEETLDDVLPDGEQPQATEESAETVAATDEEQAEQPTEEAEQTEGEPEAEADGEPEAPRRVRIDLEKMSPRDRAILLEAKRSKISFAEAETLLFGKPAAIEQQPTQQADQPKVKTSAELRQEIAQLMEERRKVFGPDVAIPDPQKQLEVMEKLDAAKDALQEAVTRENAQTAEAEGKYQTAFNASMEQAKADFPEAFTPGNPLHDSIKADKARLEQVNPTFFDDPEWPELLVAKHANRLGKAKAKPSPTEAQPAKPTVKTAAAVVKPKVVAKPVARPVSVAPGGRTAGVQTTSAQDFSKRLAEANAKGDFNAASQILREIEAATKAA